VATKVTISKRLEEDMRDAVRAECATDALEALEAMLKLLDAAHSFKASGAGGPGPGLSAKTLLEAVRAHREVVLPPVMSEIARRAYARLTKCLRDNGVTLEQANALGVWLAGPGMKAAPGEITIDRIIKNLGDWITRAVANKPEYQRPEW
jgi:hypothetical protein